MKFILSRTEDYQFHSKKWIVGNALLFWLITRIIAAAILIGCTAIYKSYDINPETLTAFNGDPSVARHFGKIINSLLSIMLIAPIIEEGIFRLWLSFKKWQVALSLTLIPLTIIWQNYKSFALWQSTVFVIVSAIVFYGVYYGCNQNFLNDIKKHHLVLAAWITSIGFGLIHLIAFSTLTWSLLPYCLCIILIPLFAGCACTYLRINLGFWWGLGMHIFNNIPAAIVMLSL
ncbi:MAG: CPBP family intramembrane metalloprotease [Bacteroides sp.]|nr:CPBP family intramembrane metalloprotease [Bacteroides sp.]